MANLDSGVGVYAPDAESYTTFKALFDPIIEVCYLFGFLILFQEYHGGFSPSAKQPATDLGASKLAELAELDKEGKYIISTRIRCGRSFQEFAFNPNMSEADYKKMETIVQGESPW